MSVEAARILTPARVQESWVDAQGALRAGYYTAVFDGAIDDLKDAFGLDAAWRAANQRSTVALEAVIRLLGEARALETLVVETRILDFDHKRIHLGQLLTRNGEALALRESLAISFDLRTRRSCDFAPEIAAGIAQLAAAQHALEPWPWARAPLRTAHDLE